MFNKGKMPLSIFMIILKRVLFQIIGLAAQQLESTKYEGRDYHTINKCSEFLDVKWCLSIVLSSLSSPVLRVQIGPNRTSDRSKLSHLTHSCSTIISQLNVSFIITILSHQEVTQANCCIQLSNLWVGFNELNVVTKTQWWKKWKWSSLHGDS